MPSAAATKPEEPAADKDKSGKGKGPSKSKDLSHVPCKFFRVGGCTAGPSCPFSHHVAEPGESKSVCTWFVKGSCKFGHKCALAHILPGQPMSMDKRNKRAAQAAAGGKSGDKGGSGGDKSGDKGGAGQGRERNRRGGHEGDRGGRSRERKSTLLGTPPAIGTGIGSKAPITISKAAPTPAALSGPALTDTDFPTFGLPDDLDELTATPRQPPPRQFSPVASVAHPPPPPTDSNGSNAPPTAQSAAVTTTAEPPRRPSPLPLSRSSGSYSSAARAPRNNAPIDFGPVGSPPQASPAKPGFIPGHATRTSINGLSAGASPPVRGENPAPFGSSPFSAPGSKSLFLSYSLDLHEPGRQSAPFDSKWGDNKRTIRARDLDSAVEDEDLEEFLPSSLTDLLSPGERERRMSRTKHGARPSVDNHLFSRSVPSTNMLDIKSIWDEQNKARGRDADPSTALGNSQARGLSQGRYGDEENRSTSSSLMGTSNVSAGFLAQRPANMAAGMRASAQSYDHNPPEFAISASIDPVSTLSAMNSRPIPGVQKAELSSALSPSTRALRNHAPGQSLPQGLAAGLSRLHLVPAASASNGQYDWSPDGPRLGTTPRAYDPFSFEDNTPPRPTFSTLNNRTGPSPSGLPMSRTPSSSSNAALSPPASAQANPARRWPANAWASPLAKPAATNDEEVGLFPMDEAMD